MKRTGNGGWMVLGLLLLGTVIFAIAWIWPKPQSLGTPGRTAYYRGFKFLGQSFHRIILEDDFGWTDVRYDSPGWNEFTGYYRDGTLREEGVCMVSPSHVEGVPFPDTINVRSGRFYHPDGTLRGHVENGTGTYSRWTGEGVQIEKGVLKDSEFVRFTRHHPNGQLIYDHRYINGVLHGDITYFDPDGKKVLEAHFEHGEPMGKWVYYQTDGTIDRVRNYAETD